MDWANGVLIAVVAVIALPAISQVVEALRPKPEAPRHPSWASEVPFHHIRVDGIRIRYISLGRGRPLLLLHTLRTQLDMFQQVIPQLAQHFHVYAMDFPGHGYSDIPEAEYTRELFVASAAGFLEQLKLENTLVVGESIGGTVALTLAARRDPHVSEVVAINPYDYDEGRGLRRSSMLANVLLGLNDVAYAGATVMRLRMYWIIRRVLLGGVYRHGAFPASLAREIYRAGNRSGHYRAFMSLVRHWPEWEQAREEYHRIACPVLLLYGDHDWSHPEEREANRQEIPGAQWRLVADAGHFLSLDEPAELVDAVLGLPKVAEPRA